MNNINKIFLIGFLAVIFVLGCSSNKGIESKTSFKWCGNWPEIDNKGGSLEESVKHGFIRKTSALPNNFPSNIPIFPGASPVAIFAPNSVAFCIDGNVAADVYAFYWKDSGFEVKGQIDGINNAPPDTYVASGTISKWNYWIKIFKGNDTTVLIIETKQ